MSLKSGLSALLVKNETTYGTDATPTGAANAVLASNVKHAPMILDAQQRNVIRPYFSNDGKLVGARHMELSCDVEMAGSGAAGTAPAYDALLQAAMHSSTNTPGVSQVYAPISTGEKSSTIVYNVNGFQYKLLGAVCSGFSFKMSKGGFPMMSFKFIGLYGGITDTAIPTPTLTGYKYPVEFNNANTTPFTLHGYAAAVSEFSFDAGIKSVYRNLVNSERVQFIDRKPTGKIVMELPTIAAKDFFTIANAGTLGALAITHGQIAGNKALFNAANTQITNLQISSQDGIEMLSGDLDFIPTSGNDEYSITVQ